MGYPMAPDAQQVIQFDYHQSLSIVPGGKAWSETVAISVRLFAEAFSSGWYREMFGKDAKSFLVLMAIVMHARPLRGEDLDLLVRLRMAAPDDEGRLYARVTDMGLADELGFHRDTVAACAARLQSLELITIVEIPDGMDFRDSHGQFSGSKVYLVAGDLETRLQKSIEHRAEKFRTVETPESDHRAEKFRTDRAEKSGMPAENFRINIDSIDSVVVVNGGFAAGDPALVVLKHFAARRGLPRYEPLPKEIRAVQALLADGFGVEEIAAGVEAAFERSSRPVRYFTYCERVIRQSRARAQAHPENRPPASGIADAQAEKSDPAPQPVEIPPELAAAARVYASANGDPGADVVARLALMAEACAAAAQSAGSTGAQWVADALSSALGRAQPQSLLAYAGKILENWTVHGRPQVAAPQNGSDAPAVPELQVFFDATGRRPLKDQREWVVRAIQEYNLTADYLRFYWQEWVRRDRKRSDLTWLEWAIKGEIPDTSGGRGAPAESGLEKLKQAVLLAALKGDANG